MEEVVGHQTARYLHLGKLVPAGSEFAAASPAQRVRNPA